MGKKKDKEHRAKVQKRNNKILNEKERAQKAQKDFLTNMIKEEQIRGAFENNKSVSSQIGGDIIDGPLI